jgi:DNA repair exonuclease SbcCD nuclease subunit
VKFIHAADIHLDSPLVGLERYDGAPVEEMRGATREALRNLVVLAITEKVDFVLFVGDLYNGDWKDYNTGLFFAAQMSKLKEKGIRVFIVNGNHDAASTITKRLRMPDNVKALSVREPESVILEDCGVALHGQGFPSRSVTENLAVAYPEPVPGFFNIGLLHTSVNGREGHERYAPCSLEDLLAKNYEYWALGHVHTYEILHKKPWILFAGNIQGRHVREAGSKGCVLVTVEDQEVVSAERRELDVLRWAICRVDASNSAAGEEVVDRVADALRRELLESGGRSLAARIEIVGSCRAHQDISTQTERWTNEIRAAATELSNGEIWVERVKLQTQIEGNLDEMISCDDALGELLRTIRGLSLADSQTLSGLTREFGDFLRKMPSELRTGENQLNLTDTEALRRIIEDVGQLLLARILSKGT